MYCMIYIKYIIMCRGPVVPVVVEGEVLLVDADALGIAHVLPRASRVLVIK